ncbi:bifunctional phosphoribosyl-AMP cyclohydrolase/phosphoribosyl-ATP diphosphatase HisIE [Campylobacter concisus]|uniref:bifunctional phosphoribosyl-AMP cyclohydrolase/phosphoribosyl-ATP diphosphatase HisIE n=1 Tax=Campylobacter concisus TaxID=199 RepID=UPI00122C2002|nr:bifunctional phosphoribosyl-AMP cyclohydrolase/phosphoribosyl-ATP diphosphatase HisIE [Campylobacter concisus]
MNSVAKSIDWQKVGGLLPVVVCDHATNEVLMLAYMNEEALNLTLSSRYAHYFSRTKNRIWKKGEESGNTQEVKAAFLDCDNDTLLLKVVQNGGTACHTGARSCFFNEINLENLEISDEKSEVKKPSYGVIDELYHVIEDRKLNADPQTSYVASLFKKGENQILKKVGEEATELVMAAKELSFAKQIKQDEQKAKNDLIYEVADLCFHTLVALSAHNIHPDAVKNELARRFGMSGIEEKRSRDVK